MTNEVLFHKCQSLERCLSRAREEYAQAGAHFATDFTRQDAAILNVQRACEITLDIGQILLRQHQLGIPQSSRQIFDILERHQWIEAPTANALRLMVGFRNMAVHEYQEIQLKVLEHILQHGLSDIEAFIRQVLAKVSKTES